mmetsp:Transcript_24599/g.24835  ORF Transcript_24599/g.24835 Transcript_24599/m.24835 type:complete len:155 (-) Transcript_24599:99-563(-)
MDSSNEQTTGREDCTILVSSIVSVVQAVSEDILHNESKMRRRRTIDHQEQRSVFDSYADHQSSPMSNRFDAAQKKSISMEEFCSKNKYKQQEQSDYKRLSHMKHVVDFGYSQSSSPCTEVFALRDVFEVPIIKSRLFESKLSSIEEISYETEES